MKVTKTHKGEKGKITLKLIDKNGEAVSSAKINVSGFGDFYTSADGDATIEVPQGTYELEITKGGYYDKEIDEVEVKAGKTNSLGTIILEKKPYYAEVIVSNPKVSYVVGSNPTFKFRVENKGYADDTYKLDVSGLPENFYYKFKTSQETSESISEIFIESGDSKDVYLEILTPPNAKIGSYNLTLLVMGHYTVKKNLAINLKGEYRLYFEPLGGRYLIRAEAGKTVEYVTMLRNVGKGAMLTNINISVESPPNWKVDVKPSQIPALEAGDGVLVKISAHIPPDTIPSEYKLKVNIKSDQAEIKEDLKVIVTEKSYSAIIGAIIIIASLAGLVVIFKKFGRR